MKHYITTKMLGDKKACGTAVRLFVRTFGAKAEVTLENCKEATDAGLDLTWFTENCLSAPAWKLYEETRAPALYVALLVHFGEEHE